jgi:hypothetical protein
MHWISRLKPIPLALGQLQGKISCIQTDLKKEKYGMANEIFALQVGLARIKIDFLQIDPAFHKITKELIYQLYYRDVNPK